MRLADGSVVTLAGTGRQLRERSGSGPALRQDLSTPWDLAWFIDRVVIAMAGTHQLWVLHLARTPPTTPSRCSAGTSAEGIRDGAAHDAWFAQPSGLATSADGRRLWVADSETSALRSLDPHRRRLRGHHPRRAGTVRLRPPGRRRRPGAAAAPARRHRPARRLGGGQRHLQRGHPPVRPRHRRGRHAGHRACASPATRSSSVDGDADAAGRRRVRGPPADPGAAARRSPSGSTAWPARPSARRPLLAGGDVTLAVAFTPPTGQKLDHRWGDPTQLMVSSSPDRAPARGRRHRAGADPHAAPRPARRQRHPAHLGAAAACDGDPVTGEVPEHAACHLYQQDWGIPVVLQDGEPDALTLDLRGV